MLEGNYKEFYDEISKDLHKDYIFTDKLHTLVYGTDASFYRLVPKIVLKVQNSTHVEKVLKLAYKLNLAVTFRAAGTSLSGQSVSDSILVMTSRDWKSFSISPNKDYISLAPSIIGSSANAILAPFGKKIGPDPASINAAMIGGIAANNASGMCCGISQNSYKTLKSLKLIFADGTRLDTASDESKAKFRQTHSKLLNDIKMYANEIKNDEALSSLITKKFKIKNTCGYSINALVDYEDEFDILAHLIIGSEGTLAFIEEITYYTVEDYPNKASALIFFENIVDACNAVSKIKLSQDIVVDAVELMDNKALKSIQNKEGMPEYLKDFNNEVTALLIETRAENSEKLENQTEGIRELLSDFETLRGVEFTTNPDEYNLFWKIRKGLFPAVGAVRKIGTTVIIEDVAYPIESLADGTLALQNLFAKYKYDEALIFGHALEGNFHFVFTQDFSTQEEIERYDNFMNDVTSSVATTFKGSLKAEHGTGRNMAAFIELEWGEKAYKIMQKIKHIFDPNTILNPGVIINYDKSAHIKNLKPLPATNSLVDTCIECGFCEPMCPSNVITFTPRHRIVANREISRLESIGETKEANELKSMYQYDGLETCATCSLCSTVCPVGIDTGSLTKYLRAESLSENAHKIANKVVDNFDTVLGGVRFGLKASNLAHSILGTTAYKGLTSKLRDISGGKIPKWSPNLPKANKIDLNMNIIKSDKKIVYFPSCINRTMGQSKFNIEEKTLYDVTVKLLNKAGYEVILPSSIDKLCCGMPLSSKGFVSEAKIKSDELEDELEHASEYGKYPVLCDTSPCTKKMKESFKADIKLYEPIEFALEYLIPSLEITPIDEEVVIHTTCSSRKMGLHDKFIKLAKLCSKNVIVPQDINCCGFAGDRGFNFPELNASALRDLKTQIPKNVKFAYSTSKTCEIGLSEFAEIDYNSIFYLIDKCSK